ncbi:hypothetical protein GOV12_03285 [Candidatus Pacearchaeota archaeon]|nr:hypothetical protein [Candidatus Pacearchaeota archaeon]
MDKETSKYRGRVIFGLMGVVVLSGIAAIASFKGCQYSKELRDSLDERFPVIENRIDNIEKYE